MARDRWMLDHLNILKCWSALNSRKLHCFRFSFLFFFLMARVLGDRLQAWRYCKCFVMWLSRNRLFMLLLTAGNDSCWRICSHRYWIVSWHMTISGIVMVVKKNYFFWLCILGTEFDCLVSTVNYQMYQINLWL